MSYCDPCFFFNVIPIKSRIFYRLESRWLLVKEWLQSAALLTKKYLQGEKDKNKDDYISILPRSKPHV